MNNNHALVGKAIDPAPTGDIENLYLESLTLVERLHRRLLDVNAVVCEEGGRPVTVFTLTSAE